MRWYLLAAGPAAAAVLLAACAMMAADGPAMASLAVADASFFVLLQVAAGSVLRGARYGRFLDKCHAGEFAVALVASGVAIIHDPHDMVRNAAIAYVLAMRSDGFFEPHFSLDRLIARHVTIRAAFALFGFPLIGHAA